MLYVRMGYVVKHRGLLTEAFRSLIGVLTGDIASPTLWNIHFADLDDYFPQDADDILLDGRPISHVEQADDVALFSTSLVGLQRKINIFFAWCGRNFMVISIGKTKWMVFGRLPVHLQGLFVGSDVVKQVSSYKYVGVWFTRGSLFEDRYASKAEKAQRLLGLGSRCMLVPLFTETLEGDKESINLACDQALVHIVSAMRHSTSNILYS